MPIACGAIGSNRCPASKRLRSNPKWRPARPNANRSRRCNHHREQASSRSEIGTTMKIGLSTRVHTSFADAVTRTREALAQQGFGVLTEIDVKATLKVKLGKDMEDYLILGACNPSLAHRAINLDRHIGLLLPCNVVVRADPNDNKSVIVEGMNPQV